MSVTANLSVLRVSADGFALWRAGDPNPVAIAPYIEGEAPVALPENTVFAVPADAVRLTDIDVDPNEARHLAASLPYLLEEELLEAVDDVHVARHALAKDRWLLAVVARSHMRSWREHLGESFEGPWIAECLLLPWQPGELCLLVEDQSVLLRWGAWAGTRIEATLLKPLLDALSEQPETVILYGANREADLSLLPDSYRERCQWRQGNFASALMLVQAGETDFDLRQGEFAPQLPLARWWQHWRKVAIAAGVAVILQLGADVVQYQQLSAENIVLRTAIQDSYRQANPRGAVVDVEKQLDRQLAELAPAAAGVAFTPILAQITESIARAGSVSVGSLNFSASSAEVRVDIVAEDYAAVEALRQSLDDRGYRAVLETSSARGTQVRARLRIEVRV